MDKSDQGFSEEKRRKYFSKKAVYTEMFSKMTTRLSFLKMI